MSLPPDPDEPTRRLPPIGGPEAPPPRAYEREVVVTADDDLAWREELMDRLHSLRTAVVLLGVLATAALGIALWALLTQEEESDAATVEQVRDLEQRVQELEQDVDRAPSRDALSQLSDNVDSLDERVGALEDRVERQGSNQQAVEDLQGDVQQLGDTVEQLGDTIEQLDQRLSAVEQQGGPP